MQNIRDVFRDNPLKNRPQSTSPQRTEQGIASVIWVVIGVRK